jgi:pyridoxine 4-dehydrogenase
MRIGFGTMQLPGPDVLRRAVELGVRHIDTAQYYGSANEVVRDALHPYPEDLRIATKVGARRGPDGAFLPAARPEELREQVEANLRSLGLQRLAHVNLRLGGEGMDESGVPMEESLGALADLRADGELETIGLSAVSVAQLDAALDLTPIAEVQNRYSVLDREHEPVLLACAGRGIAFVPYFPLGSAVMGGPAKLAADPDVAAVAARHGATPAQVALAWLLHAGPNVRPIPGTSSVVHLEENLAAERLALDDEDLSRLADRRRAA